MKRFLVIYALLTGLWVAQAQGPDDQYISIYSLIQEAGRLNSIGRPGEALPKFVEAQTALQRFQKSYPEWNPNVIRFRLNDVAAKIAEISPRVPGAATTPTTERPTAPAASPALAAKTAPSDWEHQLAALMAQVRQLQGDKSLLESKLKEALSVRPATMDPRELARAEEKIRNLQKENDLFKVSLAQEKAKVAPAPDTNAVADALQALAVANRKLAEQTEAVNALDLERKALSADAKAATALRAENRLLKKQLADVQAAAQRSSKTNDASRQLAQARAQIAVLQSDREMLELQKAALENRLKRPPPTATNAGAAPALKSADASRVKQLERERDDLKKQLAAANKEL